MVSSHHWALFLLADRLAANDHVDRVGVQLREVPQRHPAELRSIGTSNVRSCSLSSAGTSFVATDLAVDDQLDLAASCPRGNWPPSAVPSGHLGGERDLGLDLHLAGLGQFDACRPAACR